MKIEIVSYGKKWDSSLLAFEEDLINRISHHINLTFTVKKSDTPIIIAAPNTKQILLDPGGKNYSSEDFAKLLDTNMVGSTSIAFSIGPADGFSKSDLAKADQLISFGIQTISHQLARLILLEQIYRGFAILKGLPYHK